MANHGRNRSPAASRLSATPFRSPTLATLVYLLTGTLWLSSLGRNTGLAAWPLLFFSGALVHALFLRNADGSAPPPPSAPLGRPAAPEPERSLAEIVEVALELVAVVVDGRIAFINGTGEQMLGAPREALIGRAWGEVCVGGGNGFDYRLVPNDGASFEVTVNTRPLLFGGRRATLFQVRDISERRAAEFRLLVAAAVLELTVEGIMVTDPRGVITWVNDAFCKISGYGRDEVIGENASLLKSGFQGLSFYKTMWQHIRSAGLWEGEIWNRRKDGEAYLEWLSIKAVTDEGGGVSAYVGVFSDISRHKRAEETIKHLTYYDAVTRLPNSYLFRDRATLAIEHGQRDDRMVALVLVSLDRFKQVNETLGHATGDALLREVADRLSRAVRNQDTVARLRGDTFCCVLTELGQAPDAQPVIDRMIDAFTSSFEPGGNELFATASIGISVYPVDGSDVDDLVRKAETAMNRSKDAVDSTYNFYTPEMNANSRERLRLETELRKAVQQEDFVLHYQPKVDTETGRLVGAEALLRWHHPELGIVSPAKFVPIAEEIGLILQLGAWVLRAACRQLRDWQARGLPLVRIAVNLSAHQFRQPDLVESIVRELAETGIEANLIELELTESAVMHNADIAVGRMRELHAAGIRLTIDDFGTGYSSLAHLKRFPLDQLKIDRSFIQDLCSSQAGEEIVGAIIAMAHGLNLSVVAEGVEKAAQRDLLAKLRCDQIQGFFFSPAVPSDQFVEMLKAGRLAGHEPQI